MKRYFILGIGTAFLAALALISPEERPRAQAVPPPAAQEKKMPDVIVLASESKLGKVTFNHLKHNSGAYSVDGTGAIPCTTCHHTAQPAAEIVKFPPLKTAWPADRKTTLTAELFAKGPNAAGVAACRDCHARAGQTPKLMSAIPEVKHPNSPEVVKMTNQQAFHRTCDACHFNLGFQRPEAKVPKATQCGSCHKRV